MTNKVIVIGLDGATFDLIGPWINGNKLPNLAKIAREGVSGNLKSTLPVDSAVAWSSIITGKNPGKTGIFGFYKKKTDSYDKLEPVNSTDRKSKDVWEILSEHGKKVCILNVPLTYPPRKVNGYMIAGFLTPRTTNNFFYPPSLKNELKKVAPNYKIDIDEAFAEEREDVFLNDLYLTTENLGKVVIHYLEKQVWDFFMTVFTGTDRIQHALWDYMDPTHPSYTLKKGKKYGDAILTYFRRIDSIIGDILRRTDNNTIIMVISDHGQGPVHKLIDINNLLMSIGLIKLRRNIFTSIRYVLFKLGYTPVNAYKVLSKLGLAKMRNVAGLEERAKVLQQFFLSFKDIDWHRSVCYALGGASGKIYINLRGKEPIGIINPGTEYEAVKSKIVKILREYKDPEVDQKVFQLVVEGKDVFNGPYFDQAPDIIVMPSRTYNILGIPFGMNSTTKRNYGASGDHNLNGILMLKGTNIKKGVTLNKECIDITPTVLYLLQTPIPQDIDGKILTDAFEPEYVESNPVKYEEVVAGIEQFKYTLSKEENEDIKKRLKMLGYLQ